MHLQARPLANDPYSLKISIPTVSNSLSLSLSLSQLFKVKLPLFDGSTWGVLSIKKEKYLFQIMGDYWNYLTSIETQFYESSIPNIKWE